MAVFVYEVVPAIIRAQVPVTDLKVRGEGFSTSQPRTLRFVSPDHTVIVPVTGFTIDSDTVLTVASITLDMVGTYRIQVENLSGLLVVVDGALIVNHPPVSFTLKPATMVVNTVVEGAKLALVGVASAQVGMVRFSGPGLFEIDEFGRPDPKTVAFFPLAFGFLGDYTIQLFTDNTGATPIGDPQPAGLVVTRSPKPATITGLSTKVLQPGEIGTGIIVQGSGFIDAFTEVVRIETDRESVAFVPQIGPFVPEEDIPPGLFRLLGDSLLALGPFSLTLPGEYGVFFETTDGGTPVFVASRVKALTVRDTRKPTVVFDPLPQGFDDPVTVSLQAQFTDPDTGLATGVEDPSCAIYVHQIFMDLRVALGPIDPNNKPWESISAGDAFNLPGAAPYGSGGPEYPGRPIVTPAMKYTGPILITRPTLVQAIAVDAAGNVSDVAQGLFDVSNQTDRTLLSLENPVDNYSRYANVNIVVRNLRIKYTALLGEVDTPGVTQQAAGSAAGKTALLRDLRRGLIDILNSSGKSLEEVLKLPAVEYLNDTHLKLTPGREIFASSPFPYAPGNDNWRITRRQLEFGFATPPANGSYEVLLIPSYAGHSFMDPFIRLVGSVALPPNEASATGILRPVTIFRKIATFTVALGVITKASIAQVLTGRTTNRRFTDQDLERDNLVFPKDIHYRELEVALEFATLPVGASVSTGDAGVRVTDPVALPSIADQPARPIEYFPPSNIVDPFVSDDGSTLAEAVGDEPRGPKTTNFTQTVRIINTGTNYAEKKQTIIHRVPLGSIKFETTSTHLVWKFGERGATDVTLSTNQLQTGGVVARIPTVNIPPTYVQGNVIPYKKVKTGDSLLSYGIDIEPTPLTIRLPSPLTKTPTDYDVDYRLLRKFIEVRSTWPSQAVAIIFTSGNFQEDSAEVTILPPSNWKSYYGDIQSLFLGSVYDVGNNFQPSNNYFPVAVQLVVDGSITISESQPNQTKQVSATLTYAIDGAPEELVFGTIVAPIEILQIALINQAQFQNGVRDDYMVVFGIDYFPFTSTIRGGDLLQIERPSDPSFGLRSFRVVRLDFDPFAPPATSRIILMSEVANGLFDITRTKELTQAQGGALYVSLRVVRPPSPVFDILVPTCTRDNKYRLDLSGSENADFSIQMYNYKTRAWLTEEESQQEWPSSDVRPASLVSGDGPFGTIRLRMTPKDGLTVGDVEDIAFQVFLNGKLAYGPI